MCRSLPKDDAECVLTPVRELVDSYEIVHRLYRSRSFARPPLTGESSGKMIRRVGTTRTVPGGGTTRRS
jgi:hypothetical protein